MANIWVSSDPHFSHEGMLRFLDINGEPMRKFASVDEMDQRILDEHNGLVKTSDHFYCLGDVAMRQSNVKIASLLNSNHKRLVRGNHDIYRTKTYLDAGFKEIYATRYFEPDKPGGVTLLFSHYPLHPNSIKPGWVNVHGHVHNNIVPGALGPKYLNVSLEVTDYKPLNIEELRSIGAAQLRGIFAPAEFEEIEVCLGCNQPMAKRDCGCPAGTGLVRRRRVIGVTHEVP